jgi:hypothetical protein
MIQHPRASPSLASPAAPRHKRLRRARQSPPRLAFRRQERRFLNARSRKLVGAVALITFVVVYAVVAGALAESRPLQEAATVWRVIGYAVLGLAWTLPAGALIRWMERPERRN